MKIIIADDHAMFRDGIRLALFEAYGPETVVIETENYGETLSVLQAEPDCDLVICDLNMPGMEAFNGLRRLVAGAPQVPLVVLSADENPESVISAIECGAKGYIYKRESFEVLHCALGLVMSGGSYIPAQALAGRGGAAQSGQEGPAGEPLTKRQSTILSLVGQGLSNKEVARLLEIAEGTVKAQLRTVYRKMGVRNRTEAALLANAEPCAPEDLPTAQPARGSRH